MAIEFYILESITSPTPTTNIDESCWTHLRSLKLADPTFGIPGRIDALIGADVWGAIIQDGIVRGSLDEPFAQATKLGWVVFGPASVGSITSQSLTSLHVCCDDQELSLDDLLRRFWEIEEPLTPSSLLDDSNFCESLFVATHRRDLDGRYVVQIPFRPDALTLGDSYAMALQQFLRLERKLNLDAELKRRYVAFMDEYLALGHMREATYESCDPSQAYYIPHHAVMAKFRVVFNASAKSSNGVALNDTQFSGPMIQETLFNIILRFRRYLVALSADIEKMFRQIRIDERHLRWQRILWRESATEPLRIYELTTVTYGMACSPYNSVRALQQCGTDNSGIILDVSRAALAQQSIFRDFYVDDYLTSVETTHKAVQLANDVDSILRMGHFILRKWQSNDGAAVAGITKVPISTEDVELRSSGTTVLGLHWDPLRDELFFKVALDEVPSNTKRQVLSDTARLFDPMGLLAPVIIVAKIFMQKLWLAGLEWDTPLPASLLTEWLTFRNGLPQLDAIRIPRWLGLRSEIQPRLHGFCDASERAYAAVIYLSSINHNGERTSILITSKTKVAPVKAATIPRLELCAAQLLASTMASIIQALELPAVPYSMWSDSTIVLCWLRKSATLLKPYVANRVGYIQQHSDLQCWHHIRTQYNPADCASRGISAEALRDHKLWWHGPDSWLIAGASATELPILSEADSITMASEEKPVTVTVARVSCSWSLRTTRPDGSSLDLLDRFSSIGRLIRTTAYILRWHTTRRHHWHKSVVGADEMDEALQWHIRTEQYKFFGTEIHLLGNSSRLPSSSSIVALAPFLDHQHILRVGGRLKHAQLDDEQRHPMILAKYSRLTRLIVREAHTLTLHGGIQLMLQTLRQKYWIIHGRAVVKRCIHECVTCRRYQQAMSQQQMASLPRSRVVAAPPFSSSGVDYGGPFNIRVGTKRTRTVVKTYVAIFVCMATKAVHIELAEDLSSQAFLNVFARFISRRGPCHHLYSDNGTAFVGANTILKKDLMEWRSTYTQQQVANLGTTWHFITPEAPHQGGLWEAAVKSAKRHLLRVTGKQSFFYDQLHTLLSRIEACLNSRPLIALHDGIDDHLALSPADFLIGRSLVAVPEPPIADGPIGRLKQWQNLRHMHQQFWQKWHDDYLASLQTRSKWHQASDNLQLNDIVAVRKENLPPTHWRLGKIIAVHPGDDGLVRSVTIQHTKGTCTRSVQRKDDPLKRIQEEINEVARREQELREKMQLQQKEQSPPPHEPTSLTHSDEASSCVGAEETHSDDSGISASSSPINGTSANTKPVYIRPNSYSMAAKAPQPKFLLRASSTPQIALTGRRFNISPAQKGIMQRFIAQRGKLATNQSPNGQYPQTPVAGRDPGTPMPIELNRSSLDLFKTPTVTSTWTPPIIERDQEGRPIRRGYVPVEEKIQKELRDLKTRESELKRQRKLKSRQSQPDLLDSIEDEEYQSDEDSDVEHCFAPGKLRATKSISELCDNTNTMSPRITPSPSFDRKPQMHQGLRPAISLAQLCDLDPDEAPSSHDLIAKWESLIQKNA